MIQVSFDTEKPFRIQWDAANGSAESRLGSWQAWKEATGTTGKPMVHCHEGSGARYYWMRRDAMVMFLPASRLPR